MKKPPSIARHPQRTKFSCLYLIATEASYPYIKRYERFPLYCAHNESVIGARMDGYVQIPGNDEEILKIAVSVVGPIAVNIAVCAPFMAQRDPKAIMDR